MTKRNTGLSTAKLHKFFPQAACQSHLIFYGGELCPNRRAADRKICYECAARVAESIGWKSDSERNRRQEDQVRRLTEELAEVRQNLNDIADDRQQINNELFKLKMMTPAQRREESRVTDGTVYALLSGYNVKVGWTGRDLQDRLREYPPSTQLLVHFPGARGDETRVKRKFSHLKTHGNEWFPYAPQVTEWVDQMIREHGEPNPGITCGPAKYQVPRPHSDKTVIRPRDYRGKTA